MIFNINSNYNNQVSLSSINEVYIGKTPELLAIEKQLDIFRSKYMGNYLLNNKVNSDPDLLQFNRMIEDYFGFGCFALSVMSVKMINACTSLVDVRVDTSRRNDDFIVDKKGYKFKKEADYTGIVYINTGIIFNPNFTTGECMAIILHEIGHNFFKCMSGDNCVMSGIFKTYYSLVVIYSTIQSILFGKFGQAFTNILDIIFNSNAITKSNIIIERELRKQNSIFIKFKDSIDNITSLISTVKNVTIQDLLRVISFGTIYSVAALPIILNKITSPFFIMSPISYKNELTADNFATIYGYGPEASSVFGKFDGKEKDTSLIMNAVNEIPIFSSLLHLNELIPTIIICAFDEHPENVNRCKDQLDLLRREVQKEDLDPKMRKAILSDITACEGQMNKFMQLRNIKDPYLYKKVYNNFLIHMNGGLKNVLLNDNNEKRFEDYDKQYEKYKK